MSINTVKPEEVHSKLQSGEKIKLIDVRTPAEFQEVHVTVAENYPLDQLNPERIKQITAGDEPLYVICKSGTRGKMACEKLQAAGVENILNVEGGTSAWVERGYDVVRGESKVISLERQVRIAAGALVLIGVITGFLVHPALFGIAAFVGAGLMFAGITDTCGMAMILARMPWNQVRCENKPSKTPV
ncbi:MAG: rhodanese-like domain-containing protein [Planctomycetaceae bacterium]|nr:rhodanese-like domain-containing protein [Planctomycetaceae bacterium]